MSTKRNDEPQQHPNLGIAAYAPGNETAGPSPVRPEITHRTGLNPAGSDGPGAWDHVAAGIRGGLADFVSRLHGERAPEPEKAVDHDERDR